MATPRTAAFRPSRRTIVSLLERHGGNIAHAAGEADLVRKSFQADEEVRRRRRRRRRGLESAPELRRAPDWRGLPCVRRKLPVPVPVPAPVLLLLVVLVLVRVRVRVLVLVLVLVLVPVLVLPQRHVL